VNKNVIQEASGRWPEIIVALAGVGPGDLCSKEGPCPLCSGGRAESTRFRFDDLDGSGSWFCSHCGGKRGQGGGGSGADFLMRANGWSFAEACRQVDRFLGGEPAPRHRPGPPREAGTPWLGEMQAFDWLASAEALQEGEEFDVGRGRRRAYARRWAEWSAQHPEEAAAIVLEAETVQGVTEPPGPRPDTVLPGAGRPHTLRQARAALAAAVGRGASRADLAELVAQLGRDTELPASAIRDLLRALQQEQDAGAALEVEAARLTAAADRQEVGGALITLAGLFPPSLADAIRTRVQYLPSDDIAAAGVFLAAAAGVMKLGGEVVASRAGDFRVPLNLYGCLVGRSGSKKGPVWKLLLCQPLKDIESRIALQNKRAEEAWKTENKGKKPYERTDPPARIHLTTKEFTGEALDHQLQIQEQAGLGLMINRDELKGMFSGLNAYRGGRGGDSEQLLEAYDGSGSSSLRVGAEGGGRFYMKCQLSIFGTIQPAVLERLVADGDASGLWARFLFVPMPERVVALPAEESEDDARAGEASANYLSQVIQAMHSLPRLSLALAPPARAAFMDYEARCQGDALRAPIGAQGAAWGKAPGCAGGSDQRADDPAGVKPGRSPDRMVLGAP
jgi:hypothetical protein